MKANLLAAVYPGRHRRPPPARQTTLEPGSERGKSDGAFERTPVRGWRQTNTKDQPRSTGPGTSTTLEADERAFFQDSFDGVPG